MFSREIKQNIEGTNLNMIFRTEMFLQDTVHKKHESIVSYNKKFLGRDIYIYMQTYRYPDL